MARRTKEEAQATRSHILDTAELVFQERGVSRTSLNDIALAAGLTRGAIYWHFKDKGDLFNAMMLRVTLPMEQMVHASDDPQLDAPVDHILESFVDALRKTVHDPQVRRVFDIASHKVEYVDELDKVWERHRQVHSEMLERVESALKRAVQRGQIVLRAPARTVAIGLHALIDGLIRTWLLEPDSFDLVRVGRQVLEGYLAGMAPVPPAITPVPGSSPAPAGARRGAGRAARS
jgi:TetR/AcrR family acrAB operon transcriptional repressor